MNVLLNNVDITKDCFYIDRRRGVVRRWKRIDGQLFADRSTGKLAVEEVRGKVRTVKAKKVK